VPNVRPFTFADTGTLSIDRWAIYVDIPWKDQTPWQRRASNRLPRAFETINQNVVKLALKLSTEAERSISPARIFGRSRERNDNDGLADYVVRVGGSDAGMVRVFVSPLDIYDKNSSQHPRGLSHLLKIDVLSSAAAGQRSSHSELTVEGWYAGGKLADALLRTSCDKWPLAIEDVLLDICMFHCFLDGRQRQAIQGATLSAHKVSYVRTLGVSTYYGPILEYPRYIPLASICRGRLGFDVTQYIQHWPTLLTFPIATSVPRIPPSPAPVGTVGPAHPPDRTTIIVNGILQRHTKGPQISARSLRRLLDQLDSGVYYLLRAEKRPKSRKERLRLAWLFNSASWKTGRLKVVKAVDRSRYMRLHPYISVLRFEVPDEEENSPSVAFMDLLGTTYYAQTDKKQYRENLWKFKEALSTRASILSVRSRVYFFSGCAYVMAESIASLVDYLVEVRGCLLVQHLYLQGAVEPGHLLPDSDGIDGSGTVTGTIFGPDVAGVYAQQSALKGAAIRVSEALIRSRQLAPTRCVQSCHLPNPTHSMPECFFDLRYRPSDIDRRQLEDILGDCLKAKSVKRSAGAYYISLLVSMIRSANWRLVNLDKSVKENPTGARQIYDLLVAKDFGRHFSDVRGIEFVYFALLDEVYKQCEHKPVCEEVRDYIGSRQKLLHRIESVPWTMLTHQTRHKFLDSTLGLSRDSVATV
jgi:hypothetical protein